MSISLSPRPSTGAANPTRRQLDELDALLQRMLDLPVDNGDTLDAGPLPSAPPVSYTTTEEPEPPRMIDFHALKQKMATPAAPPETNDKDKKDEDSWVPLSSTWQPSSLTWKPLAQSWQQTAAAPSREAEEKKEPAQSAAGAPRATPAWEAIPEREIAPVPDIADAYRLKAEDPKPPADDRPAAEPIRWWALPLVAFNWCFDLLLLPFGPVGRFFRGRSGRFGLGAIGLYCLLAALGVLFADWIGWTW
jgi:hypothetical protein